MHKWIGFAAAAAMAVAASDTTGRETTTVVGKVRTSDGGQAVFRVSDDGARREASLQTADRHVVRSLTLFMGLGELRQMRRLLDETIAELERQPGPAPTASAPTK